jgi:tetratricopeptide (TPR) repeat protein
VTKLFISYAHLDSESVVNVTNELREAGHDVWIDAGGIQGGDLWVEEITQAIIDCDFFLLFISPHSVKSDHVRRELDIAFEETKKVLPLRLEKADIPVRWRYQLAGIQYIDYQTPHWKSRTLIALSSQSSIQASEGTTGKLRNPFNSRPILEPIERRLILANREAELSKALSYLEDHRLLLVTGLPGIGKSTFACALLDFRPPDSPAAFWYDFERQKSSGNTLGVLLDRISGYLDLTLNLRAREKVMAFRQTSENASVSDVDTLIGFLNQSEPIWLVFDNLETVLSMDTQEFLDDGLALLFDSLKNTNHNAKIIITNPFVPVLKTGELLLEIGTQPAALDGIDSASSIDLLRAYGVQESSGENLELLVRKMNGHPFVLNYAAHFIQSMGGLSDLETILEEVTGRFAESLKKRLSSPEYSALQAITVLNREMRLNGLCQIAQTNHSTIIHLREKGLLQTNNAGFFWLHNIVRNSIKLTDPSLLKRVHKRAMDFYRRQEIPVFRQSIDAYANVLEWHHHAVEAGDVVSAFSALFGTGLEKQLTQWNEYDLLITLCDQILACMFMVEADLSQVQANLSNIERARIYHTLGNIHFLLGDFAKSISQLESALLLLHSAGDDEFRVTLMIHLAESYNANKNIEDAMDLCQQVAGPLLNIKDDALQAKFLHLQGIIHRDTGEYDAAMNDLEAALKIYERQNRPIHLGNARIDLGTVYFYQNRFADAIINYQLALISFEAQGDLRGTIIARFNVADIMLQRENFQSALDEIYPAVELARKRKFAELEVQSGLLLVEAQIALSLFEDAERELERLHPYIVQRGSLCSSGYEMILRAYQYSKQKKPDQAINFFDQALRLLENPDCRYEFARGCLLFANFIKEQNQMERARDALSRANTIFAQLNSQLGLESVAKVLKTIPA